MNFKFLILLIIPVLSPFSLAAEQHNVQMFDNNRGRTIPVEIYQDENKDNLPLVIINHGYGVKNTEYSFIAHALAKKGYFVISIQHDLRNDTLLPRTGNLFERRKLLWERGVKNILFVVNEFKNHNPKLNLNKLILIGHSNGGDISMMFASQYPEMITKIISLDSLRYPFPADKGIPILRFAATDTKPAPPIIGHNFFTSQFGQHIADQLL